MDEREEGAMRPALLADRPELASKDVGPLEAAMTEHRNMISDLHGEIRMLAQQLTPVLQPTEVEPGTVRAVDPSPPRSPHVADVIEQTDRIQDVVLQLRGLRSYLDVR